VFGALFLISPIRGFRAIRKGQIARHREWMIRMCAVALGVSTVRLCGIVLAIATKEGPEVWFGYSVWLGFTITVWVAELWIRHTRGVPNSARPAGTPVAFSEGT
ncbi:MAG TPA: DUF2306 domain-containing protein, partial [Thermoanaerobaculia bacterium]|nr:DUF2306 domain-containing protein [Thermoanaerobaculia bacterium]